ncbi:hypothetical protein D9M69_714390 [compost metagenome]
MIEVAIGALEDYGSEAMYKLARAALERARELKEEEGGANPFGRIDDGVIVLFRP